MGVQVSGRWPNARVPYTISDAFDSRDAEVIRDAMTHIQNASCVTFSEREEGERDYVAITAIEGNFISTIFFTV